MANRKIPETLEEAAAISCLYFVPEQITKILNTSGTAIAKQARECPERLGFNVIVLGCLTKIPKIPFLRFMGWDFEKGRLP